MVPWLNEHNTEFPSIDSALTDPNGLLAVGGDLSEQRLISAYTKGIFPWFNQDEPILWWSPAPRCVLYPQDLHVSKSLAKCIRQQKFTVTFDQNFNDIINHCSDSRKSQEGTWITDEMKDAYNKLFKLGCAHSVEVWHNDTIVGGLYGLSFGAIFFGESMFSYQTNASKVGFCALVNKLKENGFSLIDCQVHSNHLASLGAINITRETFLEQINNNHNKKDAWFSN